jgi:predicted acylesterase/phospholipase RssA/CRP-like cAMP-binding protein
VSGRPGAPAPEPSGSELAEAGIPFLASTGVLADLPPEVRERLAAEASEIAIGAGEWLFREGEAAESLFAVTSGRLEVLVEGPPETVIRVLRRGDLVGELAMLRGEPRSASVRARRDSELLELRRPQFEALIAEVPGFALGLTRALSAQLATSRAPALSATPPECIAVVGLEAGAPVDRAAELLVEALRRHGSAAGLRAEAEESAARMSAMLDRADRAEDRVVLIGTATRPGDPWTDFCLRESDLVVAVTGGAPERAWLERPQPLFGCELIVTGRPAGGVGAIEALRPGELQVLGDRDELGTRIESLARRLAGRSVGLVLSGGGARALAHIGVLEELEAAGVTVDRIGAVSLGAIVGGAAATGASAAGIRATLEHHLIEDPVTRDYTLPAYALLRGRKAMRGLEVGLGSHDIEELPKRFFCLSCDIVGRETVVHRRGPLAEAVYASLAIPALFPPLPTPDGRLLVDGGVLDNLPVATMAGSGEGPVIAVDVTGDIGASRGPARPGLARYARRALTGSQAPVPRIADTVMRTVVVGSSDTVEAARRHADLVITPRVDGIGLLQWRELPRAVEAGRVAAREALAASEMRFGEEREPRARPGARPPTAPEPGRGARA